MNTMGWLYRFTNKVIPEVKDRVSAAFPSISAHLDELQGLHPTNLGELLEKLERLEQRGIKTESIIISPVIEEGKLIEVYEYAPPLSHIHLPAGPLSKDTYLYLKYEAELSDGITIRVQERVAYATSSGRLVSIFDPDDLQRARARLEEHAKIRASSLRHVLGYNTAVGYTIEGERPSFLRDIGDFVE